MSLNGWNLNANKKQEPECLMHGCSSWKDVIAYLLVLTVATNQKLS